MSSDEGNFHKNNSYFDNPDNIKEFAKKYVVTEVTIKMYVNYMKLLSLKKEKKIQKKKLNNVKKKLERRMQTMTGRNVS